MNSKAAKENTEEKTKSEKRLLENINGRQRESSEGVEGGAMAK